MKIDPFDDSWEELDDDDNSNDKKSNDIPDHILEYLKKTIREEKEKKLNRDQLTINHIQSDLKKQRELIEKIRLKRHNNVMTREQLNTLIEQRQLQRQQAEDRQRERIRRIVNEARNDSLYPPPLRQPPLPVDERGIPVRRREKKNIFKSIINSLTKWKT